MINEFDKDNSTLKLPSFSRRDDLPPTFDPDVDLWLRKLFGVNYELGCKWLGYALAFDEGPI